MKFIREFAVAYVLWISYVCGFKKLNCTLSKSYPECNDWMDFKNPCDFCLDSRLHAKYHEKFFSDAYALTNCTNGTIAWNYPFGNGRFHFPINTTGQEAVSICIDQNEIEGELIFNDITRKKMVLLKDSCTKQYRKTCEVVILLSGRGSELSPLQDDDNVYLEIASYHINKYLIKGKYHHKGVSEN